MRARAARRWHQTQAGRAMGTAIARLQERMMMTAALAAIATSEGRSACRPLSSSLNLGLEDAETARSASVAAPSGRPTALQSFRVSGERVQRFVLRIHFAHIDIIQRQRAMVQDLLCGRSQRAERSRVSVPQPLPAQAHDQALVHDSHALGPDRSHPRACDLHATAIHGRSPVGIKGEDVALAVAECDRRKQRLWPSAVASSAAFLSDRSRSVRRRRRPLRVHT